MKSKLVIVLALVGFATSALANKKAIEKTAVESKAKELQTREAGKEVKITQEMINEMGGQKMSPEKIEAGLDAQFGSDAVAKLNFRARLMAAKASGDANQAQFAEVALQLVGKLGSFSKNNTDAVAKAGSETLMEEYRGVIKGLLKNIELTSTNEAVEKFMDQATAVNTLLYLKFYTKSGKQADSKVGAEKQAIIDQMSPQFIESVGILNVKKSSSELGLSDALKAKGVLYSLEGLTAKQKETLESLRLKYINDCIKNG